MRHYMDETLLMLAETLAAVALQEDLGPGDLTGGTLLDPEREGIADLKIKQDGVISGLQWLEVVFHRLDPEAKVEFQAVDGDRLRAGTIAASVSSRLPHLVAGERTALNLIQRLSGIATLTGRFMDAIEGTRCMVFDTRKTTPGLRRLEKMAAAAGGVTNHRMGLYDALLIKNNHIAAAGGVRAAMAAVRNNPLPAEVEVRTLEELDEALEAGAARLLLDNLTPAAAREWIGRIAGRATVELSGGITLESARAYAEAGADYISSGAITHSARAVDINFNLVLD